MYVWIKLERELYGRHLDFSGPDEIQYAIGRLVHGIRQAGEHPAGTRLFASIKLEREANGRHLEFKDADEIERVIDQLLHALRRAERLEAQRSEALTATLN
jgi:hypothetical protein